jgi:hypothetical protein
VETRRTNNLWEPLVGVVAIHHAVVKDAHDHSGIKLTQMPGHGREPGMIRPEGILRADRRSLPRHLQGDFFEGRLDLGDGPARGGQVTQAELHVTLCRGPPRVPLRKRRYIPEHQGSDGLWMLRRNHGRNRPAQGVAKENRRLRDDVSEERSDIHGVVP